MSGLEGEHLLLLFSAALIVAVRVYALVRWLWNYPMAHGPGFFLGVEVVSGFYQGEGVRWLKRYRTILLAEHLLEALALVVILASGRWSLLPGWAGGAAILATATFLGFIVFTRGTLGANPPVRSSAVVALETRRLGDYISWPSEALIAGLIVFSWALLLTRGDRQMYWNVPLVMTYVVVGLLAGKVIVVRSSFPLPGERTEEHHQWMEAQRRWWLRVIDTLRWFLVALLGGYALQHGWSGANAIPWLRWLLVSVALAIWLIMMVIVIRGWGRLVVMGRDLRPAGSWSTPFRPARLMMPGYTAWFAVWFGGLVLLLALSWR